MFIVLSFSTIVRPAIVNALKSYLVSDVDKQNLRNLKNGAVLSSTRYFELSMGTK